MSSDLTSPPSDGVVTPEPQGSSRVWPLVLGVGLVIWMGAVILGISTGDLVLVAPVVVIGSALVPACCTLAAYQRRSRDGAGSSHVSPALLIAAFLPGGVVALLLSIVIDVWFVRLPPGLLLPIVAVAETLAQLCIIAVLARRLPVHQVRGGMVLGCAVGFGFAAFETAGLAITSVVRPGASSVLLLENIVVRGVLAPFGHGLWAALVGAALFAVLSGRRRAGLVLAAVIAFVVALHLLWDLAPNLAAVMVAAASGEPVTWQAFNTAWIAGATVRQANAVTAVTVAQILLIAAIGAAAVGWWWRRSADPPLRTGLALHPSD